MMRSVLRYSIHLFSGIISLTLFLFCCRVTVDKSGKFSLIDVIKNDDADEMASEDSAPKEIEHKRATQMFRPFGILEPTSAREARKDIAKALELVCELSTCKYQLNELNTEYHALRQSSSVSH